MANEENTKVEHMKLDDTQRVKVLSPSALVLKRFFRNRLAIIGMVIIIFMFLFSFVGGMVNPYGQSQVFYTTEEMKKDYAGATYINDYMIYQEEGAEVPSDLYSKSILAVTKTRKWWKPEAEVPWRCALWREIPILSMARRRRKIQGP